MKVAIPLGGGMSEKVEALGEAPPPLNDLLPRTVKIFMHFPPLPEFLYCKTPPPPPPPHIHTTHGQTYIGPAMNPYKSMDI